MLTPSNTKSVAKSVESVNFSLKYLKISLKYLENMKYLKISRMINLLLTA